MWKSIIHGWLQKVDIEGPDFCSESGLTAEVKKEREPPHFLPRFDLALFFCFFFRMRQLDHMCVFSGYLVVVL